MCSSPEFSFGVEDIFFFYVGLFIYSDDRAFHDMYAFMRSPVATLPR